MSGAPAAIDPCLSSERFGERLQSRRLYGSGHGRDGKHRGLGPRHARLAVATAVAFIDFVTEAYHEREG
ncbi:MAG: abortive infection family protein [Rhodospirillales bacterium]|nr:abortive infection family protein [Rhodospirillales bacterium]